VSLLWRLTTSCDVIGQVTSWIPLRPFPVGGPLELSLYLSNGFHDIQRRMWHYCNAQRSQCSGTEDGYWQAATEVWSWPDVTPPRWTSLAGCDREGYLYKMGVMMYRCLHGQAPRYLADHIHHFLRRRFSASSAPAHCTSLSSQHIWPSGVFDPSGTRCLTSSEIRRVVLTVLSSFLFSRY